MTSNKFVVLGIRYIPVISTILMTIHIILLMVGITEPITVGLTSLLSVVLMMLLSIRFGFCNLHKMLVCYTGAVTLCIMLKKLNLFGVFLPIARLIMLILGIYLIIKLIVHRKDYGNCR